MSIYRSNLIYDGLTSQLMGRIEVFKPKEVKGVWSTLKSKQLSMVNRAILSSHEDKWWDLHVSCWYCNATVSYSKEFILEAILTRVYTYWPKLSWEHSLKNMTLKLMSKNFQTTNSWYVKKNALFSLLNGQNGIAKRRHTRPHLTCRLQVSRSITTNRS